MSHPEEQPPAENKNQQQKSTEYLVRFGAMRHLGIFRWLKPDPLARWTDVIIRTDRGTEVGVVLRPAEPEAFRALGEARPVARGTILRVMTDADRTELQRIAGREKEELEICRRQAESLGLPMKLVRVEHLFGGERVIVYFRSAGWVDFRQLVRQLARQFRTRIEMRQIGVRDEARLLADYGDCGQPVCCNTHLVIIPPISMRMAKVQRATLDPTKISGRCGRLKCCLRYEYETYEEALKRCPPVGATVKCDFGVGEVVGQELLRDHVWVEIEGQGRRLVPVSQLEVLSLPSAPAEAPADQEEYEEELTEEPLEAPSSDFEAEAAQ